MGNMFRTIEISTEEKAVVRKYILQVVKLHREAMSQGEIIAHIATELAPVGVDVHQFEAFVQASGEIVQDYLSEMLKSLI